MPALNYQKRFAPLVASEQKKQTIRAKRKRPFKLEDHLYHYTGMRTRNCKKLGESIASAVIDVKIDSSGNLYLYELKADKETCEIIAQADG